MDGFWIPSDIKEYAINSYHCMHFNFNHYLNKYNVIATKDFIIMFIIQFLYDLHVGAVRDIYSVCIFIDIHCEVYD